MVSENKIQYDYFNSKRVLILIVLEDGLGVVLKVILLNSRWCLNPYCLGGWSRSGHIAARCERYGVLILIVLEDGLGDKLWL